MAQDDSTSSTAGYDTRKAEAFAKQSERLAQYKRDQETEDTGSTQAVEAKFITPLDPVIVTSDGGRLPAVPIEEAIELNSLKAEVSGETPPSPPPSAVRESKDGSAHGASITSLSSAAPQGSRKNETSSVPLSESLPPSRTNPLFPPLPVYGPASLLRNIHLIFFRSCSAVLSLGFLMAVVIGATFNAIPGIISNIVRRLLLQSPDKDRPFYDEEVQRAKERAESARAWAKRQKTDGIRTPSGERGPTEQSQDEFVPTAGGPDPLTIDIKHYARRVGLDAEIFEVETEDGFLLELWHLFNPRESKASPGSSNGLLSPDSKTPGTGKYPVLMMHGLLQSAGAFCCNDDDSLAFYLAKSGYDVWLGNNRCGFEPKHSKLKYGDPRMWAWNIRQMGVMDLSAFIGHILSTTGFPKLGLVAHSQGTTQTFVALAKEQRPEIGEKISVFCALAPAAYAGPLIGKFYLRFMSVVSPAVFRLIFGIHAFIPIMMFAHDVLPSKFYGFMGYHVFAFLFDWSDTRWDRGLRDRMFQWAPSYVSAESMRWWLGRECFAKQKCILATREEGRMEDKEDEEDDSKIKELYVDREPFVADRRKLQNSFSDFQTGTPTTDNERGRYAWFDERFPPLALWVCGADELVDGRRFLRRFDRGREPCVRVVHKKIIEGYEHLDVIWAMDAIEKVGKEVREVIWRTIDSETQRQCRVPVGCTKPVEQDPDSDDVPMMHSGGRFRMASINESSRSKKEKLQIPTTTDESRQKEGEHLHTVEEAEDLRRWDSQTVYRNVEKDETEE